MSNSRSDSSEGISIYETPMGSPLHESLRDSTPIDSSLFDTTSANSRSIDVFDFSRHSDSRPTSVATDSTLKQTVEHSNRSATNGQDLQFRQTSDGPMFESSVWLRRQTMSGFGNECCDSTQTDKYCLLLKHMSELDCQHLEMIGIEQQIQSISLKCRSIRENVISTTNAINCIINEMVVNPKQLAQKQTQTHFKDIEIETNSVCNHLFSNSFRSDSIDRNLNVSEIHSESDVKTENPIKSGIKLIEKNDRFSGLSTKTKIALNRVPALVKGYLTRRLMKTERVLQIIETIRDTTQLLTTYRNSPSNKKITLEDINFHKRLIIQLENSCHEFYDIFFNYSKASQMALISRSREHILERHYRTASVLSNSSYLTPNPNSQNTALSSVTKRVIERKIQKNRVNVSQINSNSTLKISLLQSPKPLPQKDYNNRINAPIHRSQRNCGKNSVQKLKRKANFDKK